MGNESGHQAIVLSCETKRLAQEIYGWDNTKDLGLSVVTIGQVTIDDNDELFNHVFFPDEHLNRQYGNICFGEAQHLIDRADTVVTFNGNSIDLILLETEGFDVMNCREVSYDILAEYQKAVGRRISLSVLCKNLLGEKTPMRVETAHLWKGVEVLQIADEISGIFGKNHWSLERHLTGLVGIIENHARQIGKDYGESHEITRLINQLHKLPISKFDQFDIPASNLIAQIIEICCENTRRAWELYKRRDEIMRVP